VERKLLIAILIISILTFLQPCCEPEPPKEIKCEMKPGVYVQYDWENQTFTPEAIMIEDCDERTHVFLGVGVKLIDIDF
jgi:hypothetical protein